MKETTSSTAVALGTVCRRVLHEHPCHTNSLQMLASLKFGDDVASCPQNRRNGHRNDEDQAEKTRRLEAVLFLAREPLTSRKLSQYANLADGTEARTLTRRLNQNLDSLDRSFRVEEVAGGFQLVSRSKFAPWIRRLEHVPRTTKLSAPAMETLAVVSYRQPVIRADIEAVRGVSCGEILNQLLKRDLVRISGRSDELGRPYLYRTTKNFLRLFGLRSLEDLPRNDYLTGSLNSNSCGSNPGEQVDSPNTRTEGEVEEEHGVSILVEQETDNVEIEGETVAMNILNVEHDLRMDDEDYEYEDELDDDELDEDEDEVDDDEVDEDDDELDDDDSDPDDDELDDDEDYEDEDDDVDDDEEEYEDDDDVDDDELEDDEEEFEDDDDELDDEDDEWEEVDDEEEEWEDDEWEDDEEWEEE